MNVLFVSETSASLGQTLRQIVNVDTGQNWASIMYWALPTAVNQWTDISSSCKMQDDQCITGPLYDRFHIRMWDLPDGNVIAGAHHENLVTLGGNPPRLRIHRPDAFESGKDSICDDFRAIGKNITQNAFWMNNYNRVPYCSGKAALIS